MTVYGAVRFSTTEADGKNFIILTTLAFAIAGLPWKSKFRIKGLLEVERSIKNLQTETRNQINESDNRLQRNIDAVKTTIMNTLNSMQVQINKQNAIQSSDLKSTNIISIGSTLSLVSGDVKAREFKTNWLDQSGSDVRKLVPSDTPSPVWALINQIGEAKHIDYMIVDIGSGKEWLTSRLFIFSVMLMRMLGMRCIVFMKTQDSISRSFVGLSSPQDIISCLTIAYPFLERAYSWAHCHSNSQTNFTEESMPSTVGKLELVVAQSMVLTYLANPNIQRPTQPPPNDPGCWVTLNKKDGTQILEHTHWLNMDLLNKLFSSSIDYESWVEHDPDLTQPLKMHKVLRRKGSFVAMVDKDRRFKELIDRQTLLEDLAVRVTETSKES